MDAEQPDFFFFHKQKNCQDTLMMWSHMCFMETGVTLHFRVFGPYLSKREVASQLDAQKN